MNKYLMKIELKSDLCSGNGESFGALIDNDICYDTYGIPYIPGKRLKGCLRDSAAELVNFGMYQESEIKNLFGIKGQNKSSPLYVRDACIENYEDIIHDIENEGLSQTNVLDNFTYVRAQTAVEDSGIAKKGSLRYTRAVKKGICFYAEIKINSESDLELIINSAKNLRSIGLNRNRGFGEVQISITENPDNNGKGFFKTEIQNDEIYDLSYILKLKTPLILTGSGDETETYIPGGSVMGYFANHIDKQGDFEIKKFLDGSIIFSNAYISEGKIHVYYPAPAYVKVNKYGGGTAYCSLTDSDKLDADPENMVKTKSLNGIYCRFEENDIYIKSVDTDINYHLFRSENTDGDGDEDEGNFFQYASIRENQTFAGHIAAPGSYIKKFIEHINDKSEITLGKSKTAQYGVCGIEITDCKLKRKAGENKSSKFAVVLRSPVILCGDNGMFAPDLKEFVLLLQDKLKCKLKIIKQYAKVKSAGGYNVAWNLPKQQIAAFDAGSAFVLETESPVDLSAINETCFGERINEGFGEIFAFDYDEAKPVYEIKKEAIPISPKTENRKSDIAEKINQRIKEDECEKIAIEKAANAANIKDINSTTIGRLILMVKESEDKNSFDRTIEEIKDNDKKEKIKALIKQAGISENISKEHFKTYMQTFLHQLKLLKRTEKFNETKNGSEG